MLGPYYGNSSTSVFKIAWREEVVKNVDFLSSPSIFDSLDLGWGPAGNQVFNKDSLVILMQVFARL